MKGVVNIQFSHSKVELFEKCPYKFKLRYLDEIKVMSSDEANNPLFLGTAIHKGIELCTDEAIKEYMNNYNVMTDLNIHEIIKMEYLIPKVKEILPEGEYEVKIKDDDFIGFIDLLVPISEERIFHMDGTIEPNTGEPMGYYTKEYVYDLYDFKYSNNVNGYLNSKQLHLYKYFFEKTNPGKKIRNLYFLFVPKISIRQKKKEDLYRFRLRLKEELKKSEIQIVKVDYDRDKVIDFVFSIKKLLETTNFEKSKSRLCDFCEYQIYCEEGEDYMVLPKNERRNIETINKKVIWIYGSPFSGKTTFANNFPDPLMINTDGNIKFVDSPYIAIKDEVQIEGRITKRTLAWSNFKDVITELEKRDNTFKTIVVDLLEDLYEYCRLYIYDEMNITHESDDSFRAWDKVRTEFLSTIKRLMNLDYENIILISHEDISKDIMKKSGDRITTIKPNIADKVANKIAGMVDIVARVTADDKERILSFKSDEVIFGGGRLNIKDQEIKLNYDSFVKVFGEKDELIQKDEPTQTENEEVEKIEPQRRSRKRRVEE